MKVADFSEKTIGIKHKNYKGGYICSYMFKFPLDARPGDVIQAKVTEIRALKVYSARGKSLFNAKGTKIKMTPSE